MATNQFLSFGQGTGANVLSQADWAALAARTGGFSSGTASSAAINKALRQSALAASALGQIVTDYSGSDALDTDSPAQMEAKLLTALRSMFGGTGLLATNGYMRLPGGLIMQWGNATSTSGTTAILFPTAFPTTCRSVNITEMNAAGWDYPPNPTIYGVSLADQYGFRAAAVRIVQGGQPIYQSGLAFNWMAIGY